MSELQRLLGVTAHRAVHTTLVTRELLRVKRVLAEVGNKGIKMR